MPFVITPDSPVRDAMNNRHLNERWALREEDLQRPGCHRTRARTVREAVYECAAATGADCMRVRRGVRPAYWTWRLVRHPGTVPVGMSPFRLGECLHGDLFDEPLQAEDVIVLGYLDC